ncbi:MAG: hypothetical protein ACE5FJ_03535 [Gemmatimonadales bacterium]
MSSLMRTCLILLAALCTAPVALFAQQITDDNALRIQPGTTVRLRLASGGFARGRLLNELRSGDSLVTICPTPHGLCEVAPWERRRTYRANQLERIEWLVNSTRGSSLRRGATIGAVAGSVLYFIFAHRNPMHPQMIVPGLTYIILPATVIGALAGSGAPQVVDTWVVVDDWSR